MTRGLSRTRWSTTPPHQRALGALRSPPLRATAVNRLATLLHLISRRRFNAIGRFGGEIARGLKSIAAKLLTKMQRWPTPKVKLRASRGHAPARPACKMSPDYADIRADFNELA